MSILDRLGFGCASLGSRVSARDGLAALERALDEGITWFDLAPSYGDGQAESVFSSFAARHPDRLRILTKVGVAPAGQSLAARALKPIAQRMVDAFPKVRSLAARGRDSATRFPLTGSSIIGSIEGSLKRLRVEAVHVCALHDPDPADLQREDVARALEEIVTRGLAAKTGIAGSPEAAAVAFATNLPIGLVQVADGFGISGLDSLPPRLRDAPLTFVTHSHLSRSAPNLRKMISGRADGAALLERFGYSGPIPASCRRAALDLARVSNPTGLLLLAAFKSMHLEDNLAMLTDDLSGDPAGLKAELSGPTLDRPGDS